jgi:16S rRNA processing protein RimM
VKKEDYFLLGHISRLHGTKGEVVFHLDVDSPKEYSQMESVFIELNEVLVPFFIESIQIRDQKAIVKLEDIESTEQAGELTGTQLFLPLENLPPLEGAKFYFHEIIGFTVMDKNYGEIGVIMEILDLPGQPVARVEYQNRELLMPVTDPFILNVDRQSKTFMVDLPDGLVELYLPEMKPLREENK